MIKSCGKLYLGTLSCFLLVCGLGACSGPFQWNQPALEGIKQGTENAGGPEVTNVPTGNMTDEASLGGDTTPQPKAEGEACQHNDDCAQDLACANNICTSIACQSNTDCPADFVCENALCRTVITTAPGFAVRDVNPDDGASMTTEDKLAVQFTLPNIDLNALKEHLHISPQVASTDCPDTIDPTQSTPAYFLISTTVYFPDLSFAANCDYKATIDADMTGPDGTTLGQDYSWSFSVNAAMPATCQNGIQDGEESDTDCGGPCHPCTLGLKCNQETDCSNDFIVDATDPNAPHYNLRCDDQIDPDGPDAPLPPQPVLPEDNPDFVEGQKYCVNETAQYALLLLQQEQDKGSADLDVTIKPAEGTQDVNVYSTVLLIFNQPMEADTVLDPTHFGLFKHPNFHGMPIPGAPAEGIAGHIYKMPWSTEQFSFVPQEPLDTSTDYSVMVVGGTDGVRSQSNKALPNNVGATFKTSSQASLSSTLCDNAPTTCFFGMLSTYMGNAPQMGTNNGQDTWFEFRFANSAGDAKILKTNDNDANLTYNAGALDLQPLFSYDMASSVEQTPAFKYFADFCNSPWVDCSGLTGIDDSYLANISMCFNQPNTDEAFVTSASLTSGMNLSVPSSKYLAFPMQPIVRPDQSSQSCMHFGQSDWNLLLRIRTTNDPYAGVKDGQNPQLRCQLGDGQMWDATNFPDFALSEYAQTLAPQIYSDLQVDSGISYNFKINLNYGADLDDQARNSTMDYGMILSPKANFDPAGSTCHIVASGDDAWQTSMVEVFLWKPWLGNGFQCYYGYADNISAMTPQWVSTDPNDGNGTAVPDIALTLEPCFGAEGYDPNSPLANTYLQGLIVNLDPRCGSPTEVDDETSMCGVYRLPWGEWLKLNHMEP